MNVYKKVYMRLLYIYDMRFTMIFGNIKNNPVGLYMSGLLKNVIKDFFGMDFLTYGRVGIV